jgi:hypothetical protein
MLLACLLLTGCLLPVLSHTTSIVLQALAGGAYGDYQRIAHAVLLTLQDEEQLQYLKCLNVTCTGINEYGLSLDPDFADSLCLGCLKVAYKYMVRPVSYDNVELLTAADVADTELMRLLKII